MDGEDFAGGEVGDRDVMVVGERKDAFAGVFGADPEVVHPAGATQGHSAFGVEPVVAQGVVAWGVWVAGWSAFRGRSVRVARRSAVQRSVRLQFVVVAAELVELALQLGERSGGRSGSQPALQGLVESFGLALGLRMSGRAVLLANAEQWQQVLEALPTVPMR